MLSPLVPISLTMGTSNPPQASKRKHDPPPPSSPNKRQHSGPSTSQIANNLAMVPHEAVMAELSPKYKVRTVSILSSSKMEKRISMVLEHLGRFHPADLTVLPGVVLLHARAHDVGKMITIVELVRRRIHEAEQKWFQYNRLYEMKTDGHGDSSVIEETVLAKDAAQEEEGGDGEVDLEADDLEADDLEADDVEVLPARFERAILEPKKAATSKPYMSIFLSRVPIPELKGKPFFTTQSNEAQIDAQLRKTTGFPR